MNALKKSNYSESNSDGYALQIEMVVEWLFKKNKKLQDY